MSAEGNTLAGNSENSESQKLPYISNKFRAYRLFAESTKTKLREAETVIEELRNEINLSRNAEKSLRTQISSTQNRLISLQETVKKFINISDRQNQNEKTCYNIQEKMKEFEEDINKIRQKSQNLLQCVTVEIDLHKKIKELELVLKSKNNECDLMKMEIQTLVKEKKNMETEFQEKLKSLEDSLENLKKKENETQNHCRETLMFYKQQMEDFEMKIERYEQERKSFLEDFEPPRDLEVSSYKVAWADSTVSINPENRSPKTSNPKKRNSTQIDSDESVGKTFQCSPFVCKSKTSNLKKNQNSSKASKKQKPQLEFLTQDSSEMVNSEGGPRKRRLFSTNRNHYID